MSTMKANVLHGVGDLRYEDVAMPTLKPGEVLVKVRACGICGSDVPRVFVNGTYHFPTVPGHEFAGEVVDAYDEKNKGLIGTRAAVFPLIPCMECNSCKQGKYEMCSHYNYLGSRCDGGFAQYVAAPVWNLAPIPEHLPFEQAAMCEPIAVALHALRQATLQLGDKVVIYGPGTIGGLIAQWCRANGATKVMLVGNHSSNFDTVKKLGFDLLCNSDETDAVAWVKEQTDGNGADLCFEAVGCGETFCSCLLSARPGGTVVAVGNPHGDYTLPRDTYWQILRKQLTVHGTWNSGFNASDKNDWLTAIDAMASGLINAHSLITHRFSLQDTIKGLELMRDHKEPFCKVMICID